MLCLTSETKLAYSNTFVHNKDVSIENNWTFELGVEKRFEVPFYVKQGFMQRYQFHQQSQKLDTLYRPSVSNAQGFIGTDNYLDAGLICVHERDEFFLSHGEIDSCFRHLTKILHLNHFSQKHF